MHRTESKAFLNPKVWKSYNTPNNQNNKSFRKSFMQNVSTNENGGDHNWHTKQKIKENKLAFIVGYWCNTLNYFTNTKLLPNFLCSFAQRKKKVSSWNFPVPSFWRYTQKLQNFFQVYSVNETNHTGFSLQPSEVNIDISIDFCECYIMMFLFQDRPVDDTIQNYN